MTPLDHLGMRRPPRQRSTRCFLLFRKPQIVRRCVRQLRQAGREQHPRCPRRAKWGTRLAGEDESSRGVMFNQVADDRDHVGFRLPTRDTADYGRGKERPVYFCRTAAGAFRQEEPRHGTRTHRLRASSSAFALGARECATGSPIREDARTESLGAYEFGAAHPGPARPRRERNRTSTRRTTGGRHGTRGFLNSRSSPGTRSISPRRRHWPQRAGRAVDGQREGPPLPVVSVHQPRPPAARDRADGAMKSSPPMKDGIERVFQRERTTSLMGVRSSGARTTLCRPALPVPPLSRDDRRRRRTPNSKPPARLALRLQSLGNRHGGGPPLLG